MLVADRGVLVERADERRLRRIDLVERTPLIQVRGRRADGIRDAVDRAGGEAHEDAGIERLLRPEPIRVAAQIRDGDAPLRAELPFGRHVPRLDPRRVDAGIHRPERAERHVVGVRVGDDGMRIFPLIGVVEWHRCQQRPVAERRRVGVDVVIFACHEVVRHRVRRADREASVAVHVPRGAAARRQVPPLLVHPRLRVGREPRVSRVEQSRRRARHE